MLGFQDPIRLAIERSNLGFRVYFSWLQGFRGRSILDIIEFNMETRIVASSAGAARS